jgi:hypothetical protein
MTERRKTRCQLSSEIRQRSIGSPIGLTAIPPVKYNAVNIMTWGEGGSK